MNDSKIIEKIELPLNQAGLSFKEKEAFDLAMKRGYFNIPRNTNLEELALELGIKKSAMNERLRKAQLKIVNAHAIHSI